MEKTLGKQLEYNSLDWEERSGKDFSRLYIISYYCRLVDILDFLIDILGEC